MAGEVKIRFSRRFKKQYKKLGSNIKKQFEKRLGVFLENNFDRRLRNHALKGKFRGYRSINITGDWRALYSERKTEGEKVVVFEAIGTHSQLYK